MVFNYLCELVGKFYPGQERTLPRILTVWAMTDEDGNLATILCKAKCSLGAFSLAVEPFIDDKLDEDRRLLVRVIVETPKKPVTGYDILSALCDSPDHRIYRALQSAGTDMTALAICAKHSSYEVHRRPPGQEKVSLRNDSVLLMYGRDLTSLAEKGEFDDLSDRPGEIDRLFEVLLRKQKRNAMLTGPAGVGKTALVELLSRRIAGNDAPSRLSGTRIYEVGMGSLLAGTTLRGMFEERVTKVVEAIVSCQPAVLFIDEAHLIWGAGRAEGAPMDAANILKPALGGSKVSVIGATTTGEYRRYITRDPALARRFEEIRVEEPDKAMTLGMLGRHAEVLMAHHGIHIGPDIAPEVFRATERHMANRTQPDKSVDILDSAAVLVEREGRKEMGVKDIYRVLSRRTGRMMSVIGEGATRDLKGLEGFLNERVAGQEEAVRKVVSTLIAQRYGRQTPGPLGTFLFSGATGIGKTELARALAEGYFGSSRDLLHIDLAEYSGYDAVHKLIGMPYGPSYGTAEGVLTRWLGERSSGVILFDEIEKAHPDVHRLLMGLLDEGRITSGMGERFDVRQSVAILTTNVLTHRDTHRVRLGFSGTDDAPDAFELLSGHFPQEFLGRLDEIVVFTTPGIIEYRRILGKKLDQALARLHDKGIFLLYDRDRLLDYLIGGMDRHRAGVRDIMRTIERRLVQPIARRMLDVKPGEWVSIELTESFYRHGTLDPLPLMARPPAGPDNDHSRDLDARQTTTRCSNERP